MTFSKKINHLRCLFEEHTQITGVPKDKVSEAEYRGVMLGLDMVMDLNESIKEFEEDLKKLKQTHSIKGKGSKTGSRSWWHV